MEFWDENEWKLIELSFENDDEWIGKNTKYRQKEN
jgi:hypothetical protein